MRRTGLTLGDGSTTTYNHDPRGRVTSIVDGASRTWALGFHNQGLLNSMSNAYGEEQRIVYDSRDRPVQITDAA